MKIKTLATKINPVAIRAARKQRKYDEMIKASQEKIGPYVPVSYTTIYA